MSHRISNYANQGFPRPVFLKEISKLLIDFSQCDEIELRLPDFDKQRRCEVIKQAKDVFRFEIREIPVDNMRDETANGVSVIEKLCRDVFNGRIGLSSAGFTQKGGFWHGDFPNVVYADSGTGKKENDFTSIIIVPLSSGDKIIGLLHLKDRRKDFFTREEMKFYETFAQTLGISLLNQRTQAALRERVKELTCMYGIAQAASQGGSMDEIMQSTAALLPPAWQWPDIAHGRIVLDGRIFETPGLRDGPHRLRTDLIVNGAQRGAIEVIYTEETFTFDEGPFLREERNLIDNIARALALIIEQKEAEEEKTRLTEQVRHADRLATIGQLAAGVAHELNEPLGAILGYAQLMGKSGPAPDQLKQDIERIVKASLHAREIVKKLLIFSRQAPTRKVNVDINQIVNEGLYFLESRCAQEGIVVKRNLQKDLPPVIADPSQMTQVLVNLTVNAVQAMQAGGTLTIRTLARDSLVTLVIGDTGEGMDEEALKRVFLPFFTTKEVGQGTGLGLAVVHGIVTSHGGSISVESRPGRGSTFEIHLPEAASVSPQSITIPDMGS